MSKQQQSRGRAQRRAWAEKDIRRIECGCGMCRSRKMWQQKEPRREVTLDMELAGSYDKEPPDFVKRESRPFVSTNGPWTIFWENGRTRVKETQEGVVHAQ